MAVKRIVAPRPQAPVLALAVPAYAGKRTTTEAARRRFARGSAVEVRHRLARAPRSGRWMTIFVRATVVDSRLRRRVRHQGRRLLHRQVPRLFRDGAQRRQDGVRARRRRP